MTHPLFTFSSAGTMYGVMKRRAAVGAVSLALGGAMLVLSSHGVAQITQGSGSSQQENRTSSMGSAPDSSASAVHESHKPQTKDGGSANTRGKTGGQGHKPQGAGGFDNGLYGTGAGSNK
ncbi:beta-xylosidase [Paraburkholderia dipogonis]|uniref:Beta-xylosidase n=1 Tax=Paraburkholderia dipogonis TaxID=1211383 RepID=A0A4Y8MSK5_9BURK|nr:beta-xylosidase [Paraburkholderia dipogonis]TFE40399.1 beta-xylosidase [Paraburkholderia dipogonis]